MEKLSTFERTLDVFTVIVFTVELHLSVAGLAKKKKKKEKNTTLFLVYAYIGAVALISISLLKTLKHLFIYKISLGLLLH